MRSDALARKYPKCTQGVGAGSIVSVEPYFGYYRPEAARCAAIMFMRERLQKAVKRAAEEAVFRKGGCHTLRHPSPPI